MLIGMSKEKYGIGTIHETNEGYKVQVIGKIGKRSRVVKFLDEFGAIITTFSLRTGKIGNPYHKSMCGIGYLGVGQYKASTNGKHSKEYNAWNNMIKRCYNEDYKIKLAPSYLNVSVCEEWLNFQSFAEWYTNNYPYHINNVNFGMDKDLKQIGVSNKIYSSKTCIFLPEKINTYLAVNKSNNTSGITGVNFDKSRNKWMCGSRDFSKGINVNLGSFATKEEAHQSYIKFKFEQDEKVRQYLRDLNYLPEEIIQLVRTV